MSLLDTSRENALVQHSAVRAADPTEFFTYQHPDAYYPDWKGFYTDALRRRTELRRRYRHEVDLKYGDDAHHIANVYYPGGDRPAPVIVFFHGGRWREGHPAFYDQFAAPWVDAGAVFVSCGYRLEPRHTIADSVDDAVAALEWVGENVHRYGGDPGHIVAAGHSAGGHMVAMATMTDWAQGRGRPSVPVAGTICMSSPVDLRSRLGDSSEAARLSPVLRITQLPPRVVISFGDPEPNKKSEDERFLTDQGLLLSKTLAERDDSVVITASLGPADHRATAAAFAEPGSALFEAARAVVFGVGDGAA